MKKELPKDARPRFDEEETAEAEKAWKKVIEESNLKD